MGELDRPTGGVDATSEEGSKSNIELGFACELLPKTPRFPLEDADPSNWDGGKTGGQPIWILPSDVTPPGASAVECPCCHTAMPLLLQLYAPIDEEVLSHGQAHYRSLYVFCCRKEACVNQRGSSAAGVRVLRTQMSLLEREAASSSSSTTRAPTCAVCGLHAPLRCSRCKQVSYCCRSHQALHWGVVHKSSCTVNSGPSSDGSVVSRLPSLFFPEMEIVVESEPSLASRRRHAMASVSKHLVAAAEGAAPAEEGGGFSEEQRSDASAHVGELSLEDVTRKSLAETTGAQLFADSNMRYFQQRVACEPEQIIRYRRWAAPHVAAPTPPQAAAAGDDQDDDDDSDIDDDEEDDEAADDKGAPLWVSSKHQAGRGDVPPCGACGAPRAFEFQVLPQLLWCLGQAESKAHAADLDLDFGTIAVYSCTRSCSIDLSKGGGAPTCSGSEEHAGGGRHFVEEFAWVQPSELTKAVPEGKTAAATSTGQ